MTPKLVRATKPALTGQHPGLWGDIDACGITAEDRAKGVGIASLIAP